MGKHDAEWAEETNFPTRGHVGYLTQRGGPVYDSMGSMVTRLPLVLSTLFGQGVLEGATMLHFDCDRLATWLSEIN